MRTCSVDFAGLAASGATKGAEVRMHGAERSTGIGAASAMAASCASKDASARKPGAERLVRGCQCVEGRDQTNDVRTG